MSVPNLRINPVGVTTSTGIPAARLLQIMSWVPLPPFEGNHQIRLTVAQHSGVPDIAGTIAVIGVPACLKHFKRNAVVECPLIGHQIGALGASVNDTVKRPASMDTIQGEFEQYAVLEVSSAADQDFHDQSSSSLS